MTALSRALHRAARVACFAAALATALALSIDWLSNAKLGRPPIVFDYARMLEKRLPEITLADGTAYTIAMLGDSSLVSYPPGLSVPEELAIELGEARVVRADGNAAGRASQDLPLRVHSLGMSGTGPFDYYFLSSRIARARPSLVVVALNLDHFSPAWRGAYSRPQLAGFIANRHLPQALSLPLFWTGLTTDQLLFYRGVIAAGGHDSWQWLMVRQAQAGRARDRLERWLGGSPDYLAHAPTSTTPEQWFADAADRSTIDRLFTGEDLYRYRPPGMLEHYAVPLAGVPLDHPILRALTATIDNLAEEAVETLVYVVPIDIEYMRQQGVYDAKGLAATIDAARETVLDAGGSFVDLHDVFPTRAFRDAPGHLVYEGHDKFDGEFDAPRRLAALLAPEILSHAERRISAAPETAD